MKKFAASVVTTVVLVTGFAAPAHAAPIGDIFGAAGTTLCRILPFLPTCWDR